MSYTLEQYNNLKAAYSTGATRIKYGDKEIEYLPREQVKAILDEMEVSLDLKKKRSRNMRTSFTKGM